MPLASVDRECDRVCGIGMGMMGKAVLIAVWVVLGHPPVVQQVEVKGLDQCRELLSAMKADADKGTRVSGEPFFTAYCASR
jgi:hypothetical protein